MSALKDEIFTADTISMSRKFLQVYGGGELDYKKFNRPDKSMVSFETWMQICLEIGINKDAIAALWDRMIEIESKNNFDLMKKIGLPKE